MAKRRGKLSDVDKSHVSDSGPGGREFVDVVSEEDVHKDRQALSLSRHVDRGHAATCPVGATDNLGDVRRRSSCVSTTVV